MSVRAFNLKRFAGLLAWFTIFNPAFWQHAHSVVPNCLARPLLSR